MTSQPASEIIHIIFTEDDVRGLAEELEVPEDVALERAWEWGKHIEGTASSLCSEQLASVVQHNQP